MGHEMEGEEEKGELGSQEAGTKRASQESGIAKMAEFYLKSWRVQGEGTGSARYQQC